MGTDVEVIGISVRPWDDLYHVYISYVETDDDAQIIRELFINMLDTDETKTFQLIPDSADRSVNGGKVNRVIQDVTYED